MFARSKVRSGCGQSIIETVVGIIFLIPIVLFLLDIAVLVMANTANDNLAKSVCRAAASAKDTGSNLGTPDAGYNAAVAAASTFATSDIIKPGGGSFVTGYCWNGLGNNNTQGAWPNSIPKPEVGNVGVVTTMTVKVPVPLPLLPNQIDFVAKAVEPVVSIPAGADEFATSAAAKNNYNPNLIQGKNAGNNSGNGTSGNSYQGVGAGQSTDDASSLGW